MPPLRASWNWRQPTIHAAYGRNACSIYSPRATKGPSPMSNDALAARLPIVADIARRAGASALAQRKSVTAERKADHSFVTQADRAVERMVRDELEAAFPGETILGEEMGRHGMVDAERVWLVDAIRGT